MALTRGRRVKVTTLLGAAPGKVELHLLIWVVRGATWESGVAFTDLGSERSQFSCLSFWFKLNRWPFGCLHTQAVSWAFAMESPCSASETSEC